MIADGGRYTETHYAWFDPDTGGYLYHTEANGEYANPFFEEKQEAQDFLEKQAEAGNKQKYESLSLHKLKSKKVGEAVEVLTDQAGIQDFAPDGGKEPETVYFWYDTESNRVIQQEMEPGLYAGVFDQEEEAQYFLQNQVKPESGEAASAYQLFEAVLHPLESAEELLR